VIIYLIIQFFLVRYVEKFIKREQDLKQSVFLEKERLQATILSVEEGFIATDINGKVTMINESAKRLLNVKSRQVIGKDVNNVFALYRIENNEKFEVLDEFFIKEHMDIDNDEPAKLKTEEKDIFIRLNLSQIELDDQKVMGYVIIFSDITEEINEQERIKHLSFHDELTGLYNRREINRRIEEFDREEYLPLTVISMDLNNLKVANDLFGHNTGDELIKEAANLLRSVFRDDDVVARVGGDEFNAILPQTSSLEAMKIINRIKEASTSFRVEPLWVSLAVGSATKVDVSQDIFKVINDADTKMYEDKQKNEDINRKKLIEALMRHNFTRIPFEKEHSSEVAKLSAKLYERLGKDEKEVSDLFEVAKIHDIGKAVLDEKILNVDRKLTKNEYSYVKKHSEIGYQLLHEIGFQNPYLLAILYHHERVDGGGYPKGLMGENILLEARIITIADAYEAMTSPRPYRRALSKEEAISELRKNAGTQFDSELVEIFINQVLSKIE
jgi:diguanylate cyclase (GGDEF)-like protein/PAS domain S-box-containing protein